jgi:hypothetical protein
MKSIIIEFENGKRFKVSCKEVALNRTNYYAENNNLGYKTNAWHEEFETSMQDDILLDWIQNEVHTEQHDGHQGIDGQHIVDVAFFIFQIRPHIQRDDKRRRQDQQREHGGLKIFV